MTWRHLPAVAALLFGSQTSLCEIIVSDTTASASHPVAIDLAAQGHGRRNIEVRAAIGGNQATARWTATLADADGRQHMRASISFSDTDADPFYKPRLCLSVDTLRHDNTWHNAASHEFADNVNLNSGYNSLTFRQHDGRISIGVGGGKRMAGIVLPDSHNYTTITISANRKLKIKHVAVNTTADPQTSLQTRWTEDSLARHFAGSTDPVEGFWRYLDRETDTRWSILGGFYRIALVRNTLGGYDIIYISGAENRAHLWQSGMRKGRLTPSRFENHYELDWQTSNLESAGPECSADISDVVILRLNMPLHHATLRFSKE